MLKPLRLQPVQPCPHPSRACLSSLVLSLRPTPIYASAADVRQSCRGAPLPLRLIRAMRSYHPLRLSRTVRVPGRLRAMPTHSDQLTLDPLDVASWVGGWGSAYGRRLSALEYVRAHESRPVGRFLLVRVNLRRFWQLH